MHASLGGGSVLYVFEDVWRLLGPTTWVVWLQRGLVGGAWLVLVAVLLRSF
jgi:hypothetical protein